MPLVDSADLLRDARANGYALASFNINNMEIAQAVIEAAAEEQAPLMIQTSQGAIGYAGDRYLAAMVRVAAEESGLPVGLHLDHGTDIEAVMGCIRHGWTSVMFDGSHHPLEENIEQTREVTRIAHLAGVSVEGELGRIPGTEDDISVTEREAFLADPDDAVRFVQETDVDFFAAAVGTAHGFYQGEPDIDFDRLKTIGERIERPLVLHGGSGVPDGDIQHAISLGVAKINIDTELRDAMAGAVRETLDGDPDMIDPRKYLGPGRDAMREKAREKLRLFGAAGQA